ncbi:subtilisin-like serine protease [Aequorivita sublithincola DSM 14238]|uniref:Subtilisin-like serine protease n=1 Tax=Aequorivita sublithincola (strain DSM 14238 / LMG 21431 / ACAM 643 / 9-3) TaxID=746697 RepID=I3YV18_AEQSU|nr:S8 family serine peptidase [Aequorivita sublithincola]AFL80836.1 subtilisin-like serine protease [Aequorivita sublithincola DSM 14238]
MRKTTFPKIKNITLLALMLVFSIAFSQNSNDIKFQGETYEMPENIATFQWNQMPESAKLNNGYVGWIQFYETPSQQVQDLFKRNNLQLLEYIPNKTYLFNFPTTTSISLLKSNGVRTIVPVDGNAKLSADLKRGNYDYWAKDGDNILVTLQYYKNVSNNYAVNQLAQHQISVKQNYSEQNTIDLSIPNNCLETLSNLSFVKWVDLVVAPSIKDDTRGRSLHRANSLDTQTGAGRNYTGAGIGVMVRDDGRVGPHIDFQGRLTNLTNISNQSHGDGVAGIMAGAGNLIPSNRGMAAGSDVYVVNYASTFLDPQTVNLINDGSVQITNSSYSNGCNGGYTSITQTVDQQTLDTPSLLHVFSAGNSNNQDCGYGAGNQWGNITGGHKQGKNVIATANVDYRGELRNSSSRGPAHDGRIKPDITANGHNQISTNENNTYQTFSGTSGAAPGIAGISAQLYQAYGNLNGGDFPPSALIKATLLNTANEAGNIGPDYKFGWGIVNALQAVKLIEENHYLSDEVSQGTTKNHTINVPAGTTQVRFMVYWSDAAATPGASPALVNDLDMVVTDPSSNVLEPWILDPTPNPITLDNPATNGPDHLNNVEQVLINDPAAGNYVIDISGFNVPMGPQEYYVVYELISDHVTMTFPNGGEHFAPNYVEALHWDETNTTEDFVLEYSTDNGSTWNNIATVANDTQYYNWNVPNEVGANTLVRVTSGTFQDVSDAVFNIAKTVANVNVIKVCPDTASFEWNVVDDAESYDFYLLGEKFMEVVGTSNTNSITIPITDPADEMWFAVRAKNATEGWESERTNAKRYGGGILDCTVGISENTFDNSLLLFPNPAKNEVNISLLDKTYGSFNITVANSLGQILDRKMNINNTSKGTINVSNYSSGIYFVTIKAGENVSTKKLVVQ